MRHIRLALQYDGTDYSGWQVQKKGTTIQGLLEDALFAFKD
jgi:tRNA pseudouridine38-40 synthase